MSVTVRKYNPREDFVRIRDFLAETYRVFGKPLNWRIERWNYARYFVAPMLGTYGAIEPTVEESLQAIRSWEEIIGVWENDQGQIVGVVNNEYPYSEHPGFGEAFLQRHPQYTFLLDEMLDYAETALVDRGASTVDIFIQEEDTLLQEVVQRRGYRKEVEHSGCDSEYVVGDLPGPRLPEGFVIQSMADENNIELRREVYGRAFDHTDPAEWASVFSYEELQRAPDYRQDLDLYVVGPEGKYVSCCIAWYDGLNRMGILEPVGTHPDYRRMGLGREVCLEGIRRAASLGADRVWVGSGQEFYEAIGFQKKHAGYRWVQTS